MCWINDCRSIALPQSNCFVVLKSSFSAKKKGSGGKEGEEKGSSFDFLSLYRNVNHAKSVSAISHFSKNQGGKRPATYKRPG